MKAIQATPKTIQSIFQDGYIIPEFQRPYSWDEKQCVELVEDITAFYSEHQDNKESYYLGNVVLYPENKEWAVIDGQQRLTTIMLLLNSLFSIAKTATILEECLKCKDPLTGNKINKLKIESRVIENDKKELEDIVLRNNTQGNSRIKRNYCLISEDINRWINENQLDAQNINEFILFILNRIVLLPIECDSVEDALIIFNTLNNRGQALNDADIFKAQLFKHVIENEQEKKELIKRWNNLNQEDNIENLFRKLMHIKRAENNDVSKEIGLRKYFETQVNFKNWKDVMNSLEKINYFYEYEASAFIENLWVLLYEAPNEYCQYPIITFWYKNAEYNEAENTWRLSETNSKKLEELILKTVKYYYSNAIAYNSVNTVKDTTYKVCSAIAHNQSYDNFYQKDGKEIYEILKTKIRNYNYGRCRFGLVALLAILNKKQNQNLLYNTDNWQIEHIVPQRGGYNNYNGWSEEEYEKYLNTLGNFVLLERKLNIRASNEFFQKKKEEYKTSAIQEARDLLALNDWTSHEWKKRNEEKEKEILDFFEPKV